MQSITERSARELELLDDAVDLVGVLLAAVELDAGTRGAQTRTVLELTVECTHEAHRCLGEFEDVT
jgi:hypothetical protein